MSGKITVEMTPEQAGRLLRQLAERCQNWDLFEKVASDMVADALREGKKRPAPPKDAA